MTIRLQFIGCGDAFGSGARLNTCFHVTGPQTNFLIDCGASSLIGMKRHGIARNDIDLILFTHFHPDHFGGIPFFILDAQFGKRTRPLTLAGPPGLRQWFTRLMDATFPGERILPFPMEFRELEIGELNEIGAIRVTPYRVKHDDRAGPCLAHRIAVGNRTLAYSGDTEWVETLKNAARDADLFICECYMFDKAVRAHLSLSTLRQYLPGVDAKRVILTHMSEDMLGRLDEVDYETAEDGMVVEL